MRSALESWLLGGAGIACAWALACSSDTPAGGTPSGGAGSGGSGGVAMNGGGMVPVGGSAAGAQSGGAGSPAAGSGGALGGGGSGGSGGELMGDGGEGGAPGPFELTSPAFAEGGLVDVKFRCTGDNVTPILNWTRGPDGTLSYALTMLHVGSQSVHWVLFDVPASTRALPEGIARQAMPASPAGSKQIKPDIDGSDWYGYTGPCPGSANQSYEYSVYALDVATLPAITADSSSTAAHDAVEAHQLAVAHLTGMASK